MVYHAPRVNIGKRLQRQPSAFFLLLYPGGQRLFDDPATRTLKSGSNLVDLFVEENGNMLGKHFSVRHNDAIL